MGFPVALPIWLVLWSMLCAPQVVPTIPASLVHWLCTDRDWAAILLVLCDICLCRFRGLPAMVIKSYACIKQIGMCMLGVYTCNYLFHVYRKRAREKERER